MSIDVPLGHRTDGTDVLARAEHLRTAARARHLELEAAEIARHICARLD